MEFKTWLKQMYPFPNNTRQPIYEPIRLFNEQATVEKDLIDL